MSNKNESREQSFEINERYFLITRLPVQRGFSLLKELLTNTFSKDLLDSVGFSGVLGIGAGPSSGDIEENMRNFEFIQNELLGCVREELPGGKLVPILRVTGNPRNREYQFAVDGLEDDFILVGELILRSVEVNYKDFFIELLQKVGLIKEDQNLKGLVPSISKILQPEEE